MDNSMSLDISKEVQSQRRIVKNIQENVQQEQLSTQFQQNNKKLTPRPYHGKLIILSQKYNLSLGPHYIFFFLGYLMVLTVSIILVYCAFTLIKTQQNIDLFTIIIRVLGIFMAIQVNFTYLMTALLDPGQYKPKKNVMNEHDQLRNCSACKINVPQNVRHCFTCDICILELDHHCPWMSKCVGKNNLKSFYAFIGGIFFMMALFWLTLFIKIINK